MHQTLAVHGFAVVSYKSCHVYCCCMYCDICWLLRPVCSNAEVHNRRQNSTSQTKYCCMTTTASSIHNQWKGVSHLQCIFALAWLPLQASSYKPLSQGFSLCWLHAYAPLVFDCFTGFVFLQNNGIAAQQVLHTATWCCTSASCTLSLWFPI